MRITLILLSLCLFLLPTLARAEKSYSFAVVPQQITSQLVKTWNPLIQHLSEMSAVNVSIATAKNIQAFEKNLENEVYDFAYMNPYHYTKYHKLSNYNAFAKEANKKIKGIIVVKKNSNVKSVFDLNHKKLAFPSPNAFAATLITQAYLNKEKIQFTSRYTGSHDAVYYSVAQGKYFAGGGILRTFNTLDESVRSQLKIIYTTNGYTPHAFTAHSRVPKDIIEKLKKALIHHQAANKGLLHLNQLTFKKIESAKNTDWDDVRQLNLK